MFVAVFSLRPDGRLAEFVEDLGPAQLVGRQVLATHSLGEIQLSIAKKKRQLEIEVVRARGLRAKAGAKMLPGEQ